MKYVVAHDQSYIDEISTLSGRAKILRAQEEIAQAYEFVAADIAASAEDETAIDRAIESAEFEVSGVSDGAAYQQAVRSFLASRARILREERLAAPPVAPTTQPAIEDIKTGRVNWSHLAAVSEAIQQGVTPIANDDNDDASLVYSNESESGYDASTDDSWSTIDEDSDDGSTVNSLKVAPASVRRTIHANTNKTRPVPRVVGPIVDQSGYESDGWETTDKESFDNSPMFRTHSLKNEIIETSVQQVFPQPYSDVQAQSPLTVSIRLPSGLEDSPVQMTTTLEKIGPSHNNVGMPIVEGTSITFIKANANSAFEVSGVSDDAAYASHDADVSYVVDNNNIHSASSSTAVELDKKDSMAHLKPDFESNDDHGSPETPILGTRRRKPIDWKKVGKNALKTLGSIAASPFIATAVLLVWLALLTVGTIMVLSGVASYRSIREQLINNYDYNAEVNLVSNSVFGWMFMPASVVIFTIYGIFDYMIVKPIDFFFAKNKVSFLKKMVLGNGEEIKAPPAAEGFYKNVMLGSAPLIGMGMLALGVLAVGSILIASGVGAPFGIGLLAIAGKAMFGAGLTTMIATMGAVLIAPVIAVGTAMLGAGIYGFRKNGASIEDMQEVIRPDSSMQQQQQQQPAYNPDLTGNRDATALSASAVTSTLNQEKDKQEQVQPKRYDGSFGQGSGLFHSPSLVNVFGSGSNNNNGTGTNNDISVPLPATFNYESDSDDSSTRGYGIFD